MASKGLAPSFMFESLHKTTTVMISRIKTNAVMILLTSPSMRVGE